MTQAAHEALPQDGHYYQSYTFFFDGSNFDVDPAMPIPLAHRIMGEEWSPRLAPTDTEPINPSALLVDGFRHLGWYRGPACQEAVETFRTGAELVLRQGGNHVRFVRQD